MATPEQIERALRNAHAAGDTAAATRLAQAYKEAAAPAAPRLVEQRAQNTGYQAARHAADSVNERRPVGATQALLRPVADELAGAAGYVTQGVSNLADRALGRPIVSTASDAYRAERDSMRDALGDYASENPVASFMSETAGTMAIAPAKLAQLTGGVLRNVGRSAAQGGAIGAAYGLADAEEGQRLQGAAEGA